MNFDVNTFEPAATFQFLSYVSSPVGMSWLARHPSCIIHIELLRFHRCTQRDRQHQWQQHQTSHGFSRNAYGKAQMYMRVFLYSFYRNVSDLKLMLTSSCSVFFVRSFAWPRYENGSKLTRNWYVRHLQVLILRYDMVHIMSVLGWVKGKKLPSREAVLTPPNKYDRQPPTGHQEDFAYSMETYIYIYKYWCICIHIYTHIYSIIYMCIIYID